MLCYKKQKLTLLIIFIIKNYIFKEKQIQITCKIPNPLRNSEPTLRSPSNPNLNQSYKKDLSYLFHFPLQNSTASSLLNTFSFFSLFLSLGRLVVDSLAPLLGAPSSSASPELSICCPKEKKYGALLSVFAALNRRLVESLHTYPSYIHTDLKT